MVMHRDGPKSRSRAFSSLRSYGFTALEHSDQSPMLFVDLLTRPGALGRGVARTALTPSPPDLDNSPASSACVLLLFFDAIPPMGGSIHTIKIRPIYHWTPQTVRAHIAICYMAFCCLQHLRKRLKMLGHPMSPARIQKGTERCAALDSSPQGYRRTLCHAMPCPVTTDAERILSCVGLTWNEAPF